MSRKADSFHCWFNEDSRTFAKTLNIPAKAIKEAGFNTKFPIYIQEIHENHIGLTQDGSADSIVGMINGWKQPNGTKAYRIGAQKRFDYNTDSAMVIPYKDLNYIDIVGVSFFG